MGKRMVAHGVARITDSLHDTRVLHHIFPYTEKSRFGLMPVQQFQHLWRMFRMRAVVKSKGDLVAHGIALVRGFKEKVALDIERTPHNDGKANSKYGNRQPSDHRLGILISQ